MRYVLIFLLFLICSVGYGQSYRFQLSTNSIGVGSATPTTSGSGITFPGTQSPSTDANTLDDYEEGTWTPTYSGTTGTAGSLAYGTLRTGRYTRIGRLVHASGEIELTNKGSWTDAVRISGLPYSNSGFTEVVQGLIILGFVDFAADEKYCVFRSTGANNDVVYIDKIRDNADREVLLTNAVNNNSIFYFSFFYTATN